MRVPQKAHPTTHSAWSRGHCVLAGHLCLVERRRWPRPRAARSENQEMGGLGALLRNGKLTNHPRFKNGVGREFRSGRPTDSDHRTLPTKILGAR